MPMTRTASPRKSPASATACAAAAASTQVSRHRPSVLARSSVFLSVCLSVCPSVGQPACLFVLSSKPASPFVCMLLVFSFLSA